MDDSIGGRIRRAYTYAGYATQAEFALAIGKAPQLLNAWVKDRKSPDDESLELIAEKTGRTVSWLRYGVETGTSTRTASSPASGRAPRHVVRENVAAYNEGERRFDLVAELARIDGLDLDETQKTWRIEAVAAAFRAEAMRQEARAAAERAVAMVEAEKSTAERARAANAAEQSALERVRGGRPATGKLEDLHRPAARSGAAGQEQTG